MRKFGFTLLLLPLGFLHPNRVKVQCLRPIVPANAKVVKAAVQRRAAGMQLFDVTRRQSKEPHNRIFLDRDKS
ncbi:MAG: hypothetical protein JWM16_4805 [Verrucomicrobiales bacterium]|nr:hypothetical protein [Verrucomicrobiales bacterium]